MENKFSRFNLRITLNDKSTTVERLELNNSNKFLNICEYISESKFGILSLKTVPKIKLENEIKLFGFDKITYGDEFCS